MRRILRGAFKFSAAVSAAGSALLLACTCVLWVANCRYEFTFGRIGRHWSAYALAAGGTVTFYAGETDPGESPHWLGGAWPAPDGPGLNDFRWRSLGFLYAVGGTAGGNVIRACTVPDWFLALLFSAAPLLLALRRRRRSRRAARGLCPRCGYDLRATPDV